jgi:hypothetical protein
MSSIERRSEKQVADEDYRPDIPTIGTIARREEKMTCWAEVKIKEREEKKRRLREE